MEIKYYTGLIDDLDLSVRSYNCLRRAGIQTIQDLLKKTEEGWSSFQKIRNLGAKSSREIIMKLKQLGYNIEKIETEICDWVNDTDFITAETKYEWLNFLMELKNVRLDEQGITAEPPRKGLSLMTLKGVHYMTLHRLNNENIFTIEDLLEKYKEAKQLTEPNLRKWELLRALDKAGYRFEDCSKEEFPNINDYIYLDRLNNFNIDDLEIDEDIKYIIDYQNLNMLSIVKSSIEDLTKYFSKTQIVELIIGMDEQGIKMEICEDETEVKDFIVRSIEMPTNEFLESKVTCSNLQKKGITTINKLISYTRSELIESKIVGDMALQGIVEALKKYKLHLKGDTTYKCDSCREEFITAEEHTNKHYCELCKEKAKRIKKVKEINISIKGPDYGSYTNGSTGFTLFATITNNSAKFEEVSLKDFFVYHKNRQWASTSYLTGYRFETEHIMPKSSLTAGKIWSGYEWKSEKLLDGDYISLYLSTKEKNYTFKFVLKNSEFVLDDYFTS